MAGKTKLLMFCPWCDEGQARTWQGMTAHVRSKHNDKINELKDNKDMYLEKFACDESGNPIGGSPKPEPPETPEVEAPAQKPKPEKKAKPSAPEVKPPTPAPAPKPEPKPAEGGGFLDELRQSIFGD